MTRQKPTEGYKEMPYPRCEQGRVEHVRSNALGLEARSCEVCDALRLPGSEARYDNWVNFGTYVEEHSRRGSW